jgi:hypothetical protein
MSLALAKGDMCCQIEMYVPFTLDGYRNVFRTLSKESKLYLVG